MRTYKVQMQVTTYEEVTVTTQDHTTGDALAELARKELPEELRKNARLWLSKDVTPIPRTVKQRVNTAFKNLRKAGVIARMNYTCCSSCGWAQIENDYPMVNDTVVFFHRQDAEAFDERGNLTKHRDWNIDKLYLAWKGDGDLIKGALQSQGLLIEWDGTDAKRIAVTGVREGSL